MIYIIIQTGCCIRPDVNKDEYDFDTVDGNHLYSGFLDVYDEYKDQVLLKMEKGKLDKVLHIKRRNQMRGEQL